METEYLHSQLEGNGGFDPTSLETQQLVEHIRSQAEVFINGWGSWGLCLTSREIQSHLVNVILNSLPWYRSDRMILSRTPFSHGFFDDNEEGVLFVVLPLSDMTRIDPYNPGRTEGVIEIRGDTYEERIRKLAEVALPAGFELGAPPQVEGFCTWHTLFHRLTLEAVLEQLKWSARMREMRESYRYYLIDHGYMHAGERYWNLPESHWMWEAIAEIQGAGMVPGIWIAPFVTVEPQGTVVDPWRRLFMRCANPNDDSTAQLYPIAYHDGTLEKVKASILKFYQAGVRLFKFDYNLYFFWQEGDSGAILEAYQNFYRELRSCMPEAIFIGCGVPLFDSIDLFDYMRVTKDSRVVPLKREWMRTYAQNLRNGNILQSLAVREPFAGRFWWPDYDMANSTYAFSRNGNRNRMNLVSIDQEQFYRELVDIMEQGDI